MKARMHWRVSPLFTIITFCYLVAVEQRPVVLVHGIMSDDHAMQPTIDYMKKYLPNVYVKAVKLGKGMATSFCNMRQQVEWLRKEVQNDPVLKNGFNMIAHSQGGLVARAFIQQYNSPQVYNYIAWGTPQQGIFGAPGDYDKKFGWLELISNYMHTLIYSTAFQNYVSFCNYWKDPYNLQLYQKHCSFLPLINNEIPHKCTQLYKENLCSLHAMVLVKSNEEDIIDPAESCHFGYYAANSYDKIVTMFESDLYQHDRIGLKTLYESGRLHLRLAHCTHTNFQEDEPNFVENTLPYLTQ